MACRVHHQDKTILSKHQNKRINTAVQNALAESGGKIALLTLWPEASRKAPMDAASPTQMVDTSGLICLMVSNTAMPEADSTSPTSVPCHPNNSSHWLIALNIRSRQH